MPLPTSSIPGLAAWATVGSAQMASGLLGRWNVIEGVKRQGLGLKPVNSRRMPILMPGRRRHHPEVQLPLYGDICMSAGTESASIYLNAAPSPVDMVSAWADFPLRAHCRWQQFPSKRLRCSEGDVKEPIQSVDCAKRHATR
jgi:hypothetical protein